MFKPVPFEPAGYRRSRLGLPRWLAWLLAGLAAGAGGVLYVQTHHLPPRLSTEAGERLRSALQRAEAEQQRLGTELADATRRLHEALAQRDGAATEQAAGRATLDRLKQDVALLVAALPPDPRGASVAVRTGELVLRGGQLAWTLVLSRDARPTSPPLAGSLQLVVTGQTSRGLETSLTLPAQPVQLTTHEVVRGSAPLPEGFRPQQAAVRVLDRAGGNALGMRVLLVR